MPCTRVYRQKKQEIPSTTDPIYDAGEQHRHVRAVLQIPEESRRTFLVEGRLYGLEQKTMGAKKKMKFCFSKLSS